MVDMEVDVREALASMRGELAERRLMLDALQRWQPTKGDAMGSQITRHKTWAPAWSLGDAIWWRNEGGVHVTLLTKEATAKKRGTMTEITAPSLADVNEVLDDLGFEPSELTEDEIKWRP